MNKVLFFFLFLLYFNTDSWAQCNFTVKINVLTYPSCNGTFDGALAGSVTGAAAPPVSMYWMHNGANVSTFSQLNSVDTGFYKFYLTDFINNCTAYDSIYLGNFPITSLIYQSTCSNCSDGAIEITSPDSSFKYNFNWRKKNYPNWLSAQNSNLISGLDSGNYICRISDSLGCFAQEVIKVTADSLGSNISGNVFADLDSSKSFSIGDYPLNEITILLLPDSLYTRTDINGNYYFKVTNGNYQIEPLVNYGWELTTDSSKFHVDISNDTTRQINFGLRPTVLFDSTSISLSSAWPRCFKQNRFLLQIKNLGTIGKKFDIEFLPDNHLNLLSSIPPYDSIIGNKYYWRLDTLLPKNNKSVLLNVFTNATFDLTKSIANVYFSNSSLFVTSDSVVERARCAYDPNEMIVTPEGIDSLHFVKQGTKFKYHINFQNTGNDAAINVSVLDTLDTDLDLATFDFIAASHPVVYYTDQINKTVRFIFNNILLPDSTANEPQSHGYAVYEIISKSVLPDSTKITNAASIYFDLNQPVITNKVLNTVVISSPSSLRNLYENSSFAIYPNPAAGSLSIEGSDNCMVREIKLVSLLGQNLLDIAPQHELLKIKIDVSNIKTGMYLLQIYSKSRNENKLITIKN